MLYHIPKPERNAALIARYLSGVKQSDLAREFGLTRQRVSHIIVRARDRGELGGAD